MSKKLNDTDDTPDHTPSTDSDTASGGSVDATDLKEPSAGDDTENATTAGGLDGKRQELAAAFGRTIDPLAEFEDTFCNLDMDVFAMFFDDELDQQNLSDDRRSQYERTFEHWREHMAAHDRHPACPSEDHVKAFIDHELAPEAEGGKGNQPGYVAGKLRQLNRVYEYWQREAAFPHPTDYNPVEVARQKRGDALAHMLDIYLSAKQKNEANLAVGDVREIFRPFFNFRAFRRGVDENIQDITRVDDHDPNVYEEGYRDKYRKRERLLVVTPEMVHRHYFQRIDNHDQLGGVLSQYGDSL